MVKTIGGRGFRRVWGQCILASFLCHSADCAGDEEKAVYYMIGLLLPASMSKSAVEEGSE